MCVAKGDNVTRGDHKVGDPIAGLGKGPLGQEIVTTGLMVAVCGKIGHGLKGGIGIGH